VQKWRPKEHEELLFWKSEFFLGHVWEKLGKNPSHPQKFACSLLHHHRYRDFLRCPVKGGAWLRRFGDVTGVAKTDILR